MLKPLLALLATLSLMGAASTADAQTTLQKIRERGAVRCGASQGVAGFSIPDDKGVWSGFDIDFCRALAAAIFDDPDKTQFVPLSSKDRLTALQAGEIDVLSRTTSWTLQRDVALGLNFTAVAYYDGQGFMVRKSLGVKSAKELDGATVCISQGTTNELNAADFFRKNKMKLEVVTFQEVVETVKAFEAGRCDVYTTDSSALFANRLKLAKPDDYLVLPEVISKEPLGPWVRQGDDQWFDIVRWTLFVLVGAEELGVTRGNADAMRESDTPEVRRLLGVEGNFGEALGLTRDWGHRIIRRVGNYGEIFERNLGKGTRLAIPRGYNELWTRGGLQYAPPVR
ncbi:amino acid ABC transporter substrate-binding protein [Chelatococcus sp. SYSU_G07232]|uniref:Amino acid ABC transporter substrate-binding protein n=1 Tax=Chelatococcus albus TaxID=3047466 RepID=A0ABT7AH08_9HYPH|nr:amino acid ABC transporter substrate-binding protein [Chelatococcus sp. SYSU_G07232]MDJ1158667.1 amino acid ABC transporter substrate-binding protein [Chelatococcus sp. SYSU_G07232]